MLHLRSLFRFAASLLAVALLAARLAAAPAAMTLEGAQGHIQALGDHAFATLQRGDLSLAQREAAFAEILQQGFALDLIGRFVLGQHWRSATPEQQHDYQRLFGRFVVKSYAIHLGGFAGTTFEIVKSQPIGDRDILVTTRIDRPSGPPLVAGWRVREIDGAHKIVDVVVEGISMAATQRQEFASVVKARGLDGLLQILDAKTQTLAASG